MTTPNWADMGTYGRYIRRGLNLLMSEVKLEEIKRTELQKNYKIEDIDRMINIVNTLSKAGIAQAKLAKVSDLDQRVRYLEGLNKAKQTHEEFAKR